MQAPQLEADQRLIDVNNSKRAEKKDQAIRKPAANRELADIADNQRFRAEPIAIRDHPLCIALKMKPPITKKQFKENQESMDETYEADRSEAHSSKGPYYRSNFNHGIGRGA